VERVNFSWPQQSFQFDPYRVTVCQLVAKGLQVTQQGWGDRLPGKIPYAGSYFGRGVKAYAVVNRPQMSIVG
jgi:hypothetical protein